MDEHRQNFVAQLKALTLQDVPAPWRYITFVSVGGLEGIGYGAASDLLLIVSGSGRSVVDCHSGEKMARDYAETADAGEMAAWYHPVQLEAEGIGPLAGQVVRLAGQIGGGLPLLSAQRDGLELAAPDWPHAFILLYAPVRVDPQPWDFVRMKVAPRHGDDVIVAYGFSPTGNSFVIATPSGIDIFARTSDLPKTS